MHVDDGQLPMKQSDSELPPVDGRPSSNTLAQLAGLVDEVEQVRARVDERSRSTRRMRPAPKVPPDEPVAPSKRPPEPSGRYLFVSPTPPRARTR